MKKSFVGLTLGLGLCLFFSVLASAQTPDPRDSVIIESKTVNPGAGAPAVRVKVSITNKDTLANVTLTLVERSISGGAYMTLAWPRTYDGVVTTLTSALSAWRILNKQGYNSASPDTFLLALVYDPLDSSTKEYPNPTRKPLLEIKFDTVRANLGTLELDSVLFQRGSGGQLRTGFVTAGEPYERNVNFVKGTVTVADPSPPPCDLSGDGRLTATDLVTALNCVYLGIGDCGSITTPADIVALLYLLYSYPGPLIPPPSCD